MSESMQIDNPTEKSNTSEEFLTVSIASNKSIDVQALIIKSTFGPPAFANSRRDKEAIHKRTIPMHGVRRSQKTDRTEAHDQPKTNTTETAVNEKTAENCSLSRKKTNTRGLPNIPKAFIYTLWSSVSWWPKRYTESVTESNHNASSSDSRHE